MHLLLCEDCVERQDLSCTYLAHYQLKSIIIITDISVTVITTIIIITIITIIIIIILILL